MASDETVVKRSSFLCIFCYFFAAAAILLSAFATCARFTLPVGLNAFLLSPCIRWFLMQNETDEMAQFWMLRKFQFLESACTQVSMANQSRCFLNSATHTASLASASSGSFNRFHSMPM